MKAYPKLRGALSERDITSADLASMLGRSQSYVSERMTAKRYFWDLREIYTILNIIGVSYDRIFEFFPPNGGIVEPKKRGEKVV
ncbi:MAG: helix-turn-helix domain-containing protein [Oscillospiraceae bacterium]|nr:helix-turn-helix domain-containing protein [Oscillospiraceae bacterium]